MFTIFVSYQFCNVPLRFNNGSALCQMKITLPFQTWNSRPENDLVKKKKKMLGKKNPKTVAWKMFWSFTWLTLGRRKKQPAYCCIWIQCTCICHDYFLALNRIAIGWSVEISLKMIYCTQLNQWMLCPYMISFFSSSSIITDKQLSTSL